MPYQVNDTALISHPRNNENCRKSANRTTNLNFENTVKIVVDGLNGYVVFGIRTGYFKLKRSFSFVVIVMKAIQTVV